MDDIIEKADGLGQAIAQSQAYKALISQRKNIEDDQELQDRMQRLHTASEAIAHKEQEGKPIEPEEKREVRDLQNGITQDPRMQQLARAEADFAELMNKVNEAIRKRLG